MSWLYICPHCNARLNPNKTLILLAEHDSVRMLVGFHPEPGNYEIYFPPEAQLKEGQEWDFFCPVCRVDLKTAEDEKMCAVVMLEPTVSRRVLFSRIAGDHATSILYDQELEHLYSGQSVDYGHVLVPINREGKKLSAEASEALETSEDSDSTPEEQGDEGTAGTEDTNDPDESDADEEPTEEEPADKGDAAEELADEGVESDQSEKDPSI